MEDIRIKKMMTISEDEPSRLRGINRKNYINPEPLEKKDDKTMDNSKKGEKN